MVKYVAINTLSEGAYNDDIVIEGGFFTESSLDLAIESGNRPLILDNSIFLTEELIVDCMGDESLIQEAVMVEAAKFDLKLKNYLAEGEDYKGIKKDIRDVLKAQGMSEEDFVQKGVWRKMLHNLKRFIQVSADIVAAASIAGGIGGSIGGIAGGLAAPVKISLGAKALISLKVVLKFAIICTIAFFTSRVLRWIADSAEASQAKKDIKEIIKIARQKASECKNQADKKKFNSIADKMQKKLDQLK